MPQLTALPAVAVRPAAAPPPRRPGARPAAPRAAPRQGRRPAGAPAAPLWPRLPSLQITCARHRPIDLAAVRPGDIGIAFKDTHLNVGARFIHFGESLVAHGRTPENRGNPYLMHSFVVLGVKPRCHRLVVADALMKHGDDGIACVEMDFGRRDTYLNVDPTSHYLFYRFADAPLRHEMLRIADSWSRSRSFNFSLWHAFLAPFRNKRLHAGGRRRIDYMARHAYCPHAVPSPRDRSREYKMICSEFVGNVAVVAAMAVRARRLGVAPTHPAAWQTGRGPTGHVFDNCDPRGLTPTALQARLARDAAVGVVGYVPSLALRQAGAAEWPVRRGRRHLPFARREWLLRARAAGLVRPAVGGYGRGWRAWQGSNLLPPT